MPAADRAVVLAQAVRSGLREPKSPERNARLESYVDELDRLPESVFEQKFIAHNALNNYYRADDIDEGIVKHSTWIIDASRTFTPEQRSRLSMNVADAYANMAEAWAGQGMTEKAIELLRRGQAEWKGFPRVDEGYLLPVIERLNLVGTVGTPITAPTWFNMPEGKTSLEMPGAVTLLEFTAHWCGPCKESYPGIKRLLAKYGPQGFRVVFATELYGYFGTEQKLVAGGRDRARSRDTSSRRKGSMSQSRSARGRSRKSSTDGLSMRPTRTSPPTRSGAFRRFTCSTSRGRFG